MNHKCVKSENIVIHILKYASIYIGRPKHEQQVKIVNKIAFNFKLNLNIAVIVKCEDSNKISTKFSHED